MIIILCGKSGSGKDTILNKMKSFGYKPLISYTTRPIRDGEKDGNEYHFVTKDTFLQMINNNEFIEHRSYKTKLNGIDDIWYYGLRKENLDKFSTYVVILDLNGAKSVRDYYGSDNCFICYIDVPDPIRTQRAESRGSFDKTEWDRRMDADSDDFSFEKIGEITNAIAQNCTTVNDCIETIIHKYLDYRKCVP
jgi:guanylate kinase